MNIDEKNITSILIVKLSSSGDIIMTSPVLPLIRQKFPYAKITFLVETESISLIKQHPDIDETIELPRTMWARNFIKHPFKIIKEFINFIKLLKSRNFDLAIDFQGLFRSVIFPYLAKCKIRVGRGRWKLFLHKYIPMYIKNGVQHAVENYFDVCKLIGIDKVDVNKKALALYISDADMKIADDYLNKINVRPDKTIVISPFTRWTTKNIPLSTIANILVSISSISDFDYILTGMKYHRKQLEELKNLSGLDIKACMGDLSLIQLAGLISRCKLNICADSAPMHIANALNKPLIAIFGPTDPLRTGPYNKSNTIIVRENFSCIPCLKRKCPLKNHQCLKNMNTERIKEAILTLINL